MHSFLTTPYVHAVLGNNEANLLHLFELTGTATPNYLIRGKHIYKKGLNWCLDIGHDLKLTIINTLKTLPTVIEIETLVGLKIGILLRRSPISHGLERIQIRGAFIKHHHDRLH